MANPRKFSEKIALHNQKQAEETAAFEKIMREVSDATNKVNSNSRRTRVKATTELVENVEPQIVQNQQTMGSFRSGSLPNVAAPQPPSTQPEIIKPEESTIPTQYAMSGGRSGGMSPSPRSPGQRGRASSSVGPMRRPADRKHDTSPYGSTVYLSPPPDSNWRRTNSDSALHQSCGEQQVTAPPLSPHHPLHSHAHPHMHPHQNHRRAANMHLDVLATLGMNPTNRPRSSCEIPRIPNNNNVYESGGDGGGGGGGGGKGGGLACELQVPGGSLPDLTSVHFPPPHLPHYLPHRASPDYHHHRYYRSDPKTNELRQRIMDFRLASWNVRSLYRPGALYQVNRDILKYGVGIAALQEVRWPGKGECNVDNDSVLFYSGSNTGRHTHGTGFLVPTNLLENVIRFEAISDRLCMIRVRGKFFNISIVNVYAPTEDADEDTKDKFYDHLESVYEQLPGYDAKIVVGDFNAKIGREDIFMPTIGKHSKHNTTNDNGVRLISFASSKGMVVKSTMFPHKEIYKGTWKSPDGKTVNQIDHVLIDDRHKNIIQDVRSYRGADCDSDHYMLGIKIKSKIKKSGKESRINTEIIDVDGLQDKLVREKFNIEINNKFQNLTVDEDVDRAWDNIRNTVKEVARKILDRKKKRRKRKWWNNECDNIIEEKKKFKVLAEQSTIFNNRYIELQKEAKRIIRKAKRQHLDNLVKTMETLIRASETRQFYQELKSYKKGYQPVTQMLEDEDGNLIANKADIKSRGVIIFNSY
ncbi:unnamed protein product [Colias eurytheme]|nr:unnamed protein product [Colias eurytheme]